MATATAQDITAARRILLLGVTGSGKSTAARRLARERALPCIDYDDDIRWEPAEASPWTPRPDAVQRSRAGELTAGDGWVLASVGSAARDLVLPRTQLVIYLDYPPRVTLPRLLRRTVARLVSGAPVCNGNRESLRQAFSRDSILLWWWRSHRERHQAARQFRDDPALPPTIVLTRPRQLVALIDGRG